MNFYRASISAFMERSSKKPFLCYNIYMIKVYSSDSCIYCDALMNWFDEEGIKYEYHHVSEDPTIKSVPVTRIDLEDGSVAEIVGFDRPAIKKALKKLAA